MKGIIIDLSDKMKSVVLCILDGMGIRNEKEGNAILNAKKPTFDYIWNNYPHCTLDASGLEVGLPKGQMGNSETGHLNIGAGRIVYQDYVRINKSIEDGSFYNNESFINAINNCKKKNSNLHIIGLLSDGGIHSHINHLFALLDLCKKEKFQNIYIHVILDGRDTPPLIGPKYISMLNNKLDEIGFGTIVTIQGRYYIMNRDRNWELSHLAYDALVEGNGIKASSIEEAFEIQYSESLTDEFMKPTIISDCVIKDNDSVIAFNFRSDRMIQFTRSLMDPMFNEFKRKKIDVYYTTMTEYEDLDYTKNIDIAFPKGNVKNNIGEYISSLGLTQLRITEFEKRFHVTYYFSGGEDTIFKGEDRILYERPKVFTYDEAPEMRSKDITNSIIKNINKYNLIVVNYPNGDSLGHTGIMEAAVKGVEVLDDCIKKILEETNIDEYTLIITADHGNCEYMLESDGTPNKMHTTNKVPFIVLDNKYKLSDGKLADISPTILDIMGIDLPKEMTGHSLIEK